MPKLRVLSGPEILTILSEFGFQKFAQRAVTSRSVAFSGPAKRKA